MTARGNDRMEAASETLVADPEWLALLEHLSAARGFDFSGYKPASLMRRIRHRMASVGITEFGAYRDHLEVHPDEFDLLFDTILINVTGFFRDPPAWEALQSNVIPRILENRRGHERIRAWSAGCASGEEAYTIAMLLAEALGADAFRERVKVYATDVDDGALAQARGAVYQERQLEAVPAELRERYFQPAGADWVFRKEFRRQVIFGRHNLLEDAPISHIDLLVCRNVLIYFNAESQAQILSRFHFALNPGGFLFLGRAETLMAQAHAFDPVDMKRRISVKSGRIVRERGPLVSVGDDGTRFRMHELAIDTLRTAVVLVDAEGRLTLANSRARNLFGITSGQLNTRLQDLQLSYRPVELRLLLERAQTERQPVTAAGVEWRGPTGEAIWLDVQVAPLYDEGPDPIGAAVTFAEVTAHRQLKRALEDANQELETAYEELQSTNEELETTNEELQSTIEELETTNEELQSANEELETMNEELQSANEELNTTNEELLRRSSAVDTANQFLETVLGSLTSAVAVVDRELRVLRWNRQAEELWGLRADEVRDQHLLNLDIGLPVEQLRAPLRACVGEGGEHRVSVAAVNRRGRPVACDVHCLPLGPDDQRAGAIIIIEADTIEEARS